MNKRLKTCAQRLDPAAIAFAAIPALLYLPVLYYSLDTPFGFVDDYLSWQLAYDIFDRFYEWLAVEFFGYDWVDPRQRPFWDFYHVVTWKIFGPTPWLHHLARWAAHFGAVAAFAAAYLCFQRRNKRNQGSDNAVSGRVIRLLPLTALVYLWLFFPNQPATRLGTAEPHTIFFLAVCVWMIALTLSRQAETHSRRSALLIYAAFCISFCGLAWSKETNIAAALWLLVSYYALLPIEALRRQDGSRINPVRALKSVSLWKALGGLPLIAVFAHSLVKVYVVSQSTDYGTYDSTTLTPELLTNNAAWIASELFQVNTSLIITIGLALLSLALLLFVATNIAKRRFSDELVFTLFLMGLFASLYLILCVYPYQDQILRYWYILIPVFTTLLAFSIKFTLEFAARFNFARISIRPSNLAAYSLTAFIAFFVCCNYYNFLYQTVIQHIARHNDANLIAEITRLLESEQYVHVLNWNPSRNPNEHLAALLLYYNELLPRFYGKEYNLRAEPPQEAGQPHYAVRHSDSIGTTPSMEENYRPLAYAYRIADLLQTGSPYNKRDENSSILLWQIYDDEFNRIWQNGETLDIRQLVAEAGEPIIRSRFDVYLNGRRLIYINDKCDASDLDNAFFLGAFPVDNNDLPDARRQHGFDNLDFAFADYGFGGGERCFAVRDLPEYPIKRIHTGQFITTQDGWHNTWEGDVALADE